MDNFQKLEVPQVNPTTSQHSAVAALAPQQAAGGRLVTTAEQSLLGSLAPGGWGALQAKRMVAADAVPELTGFWAVPTVNIPLISKSAVVDDTGHVSPTAEPWTDALDVPGGGKRLISNSWVSLASYVVINPKASKWAVACRIRNVGAYTSVFGIRDGNNGVFARLLGATTGVYGLEVSDGTPVVVESALALNELFHDVMLTMDATTIKLWIDGVRIASQATLTHVATSPHGLAAACYGSSTATTMTDIACGFERL